MNEFIESQAVIDQLREKVGQEYLEGIIGAIESILSIHPEFSRRTESLTKTLTTIFAEAVKLEDPMEARILLARATKVAATSLLDTEMVVAGVRDVTLEELRANEEISGNQYRVLHLAGITHLDFFRYNHPKLIDDLSGIGGAAIGTITKVCKDYGINIPSLIEDDEDTSSGDSIWRWAISDRMYLTEWRFRIAIAALNTNQIYTLTQLGQYSETEITGLMEKEELKVLKVFLRQLRFRFREDKPTPDTES